MTTTLEGQTILIVGGSSGIGFGVAKLALLFKASTVIIASSNRSRVDDAVARLISETEKDVPDVKGRIKGDVVDAKDAKEIQGLLQRVGEVDHVIWTAGDKLTRHKLTWPPEEELENFKSAYSHC